MSSKPPLLLLEKNILDRSQQKPPEVGTQGSGAANSRYDSLIICQQAQETEQASARCNTATEPAAGTCRESLLEIRADFQRNMKHI